MSCFSTDPLNLPLNFACSRRELPEKLLLVIAGALLLPERSSQVPLTRIEVQPKFKLGDLVAEDWLDDDVVATEFGQVLGMRYLFEAQSSFPANSWVYYVNWTHSTTGLEFCYPNYDGEGSRESDLRLVS
jgi:hypothetical protein